MGVGVLVGVLVGVAVATGHAVASNAEPAMARGTHILRQHIWSGPHAEAVPSTPMQVVFAHEKDDGTHWLAQHDWVEEHITPPHGHAAQLTPPVTLQRPAAHVEGCAARPAQDDPTGQGTPGATTEPDGQKKPGAAAHVAHKPPAVSEYVPAAHGLQTAADASLDVPGAQGEQMGLAT